jgi:hypothetical protein
MNIYFQKIQPFFELILFFILINTALYLLTILLLVVQNLHNGSSVFELPPGFFINLPS